MVGVPVSSRLITLGSLHLPFLDGDVGSLGFFQHFGRSPHVAKAALQKAIRDKQRCLPVVVHL